MNLKKLKAIVEFYKKNFHAISNMEIYKWRAVKHFQENWNIDAKNFVEMLENSLNLTENLLTSRNYYPRRMMIQYAELDSEAVRNLFKELYREDYENELDIGDKFDKFRLKTEALNQAFFATQKHREMYADKDGLSYQRHNAFMVYLSLRFPEKYFIYKFGEFKKFVEKIESKYKPIKGRNENLRYYMQLCEHLREEISKDNELIFFHKERLSENEYKDDSLNILTQDIIYAAVNHFQQFGDSVALKPALQRLKKINKLLTVSTNVSNFNNEKEKIDYVKRQIANQKIGKLGEELVLSYEQEKLKALGLNKQPEWISMKSDREGYDIKSYDENAKEIYIEVKTTTKKFERDFFITANELEKSKEFKEKYRLYRVYNFDLHNQTAEFIEFQGSLENLCVNPLVYQVKVNKDLSVPSIQIGNDK